MKTRWTTQQSLALQGLTFIVFALLLFGLLILVSGCAAASGARWYAPGTWFSHAPADAVDRAVKAEDAAKVAVRKAAQKASHETQIALAAAPASRPVEVAGRSNDSVVALLDQSEGALDAGELAKLRGTISNLLSENAKIREAAEKEYAANIASIGEVSAALSEAINRSDRAEAKLRQAFDRENELANDLRSQRALAWIAAGAAVLCAVGWLYVKVAVGGIPVAVGRAMRLLKAEKPDLAALVSPYYTKYLNRHEQEEIARHAK